MTNTFVGGIQVVRVTMTDNKFEGKPAIALWVAASPREKAVEAVTRKIPSTWEAELADQHLTRQQTQHFKLRADEVCELSLAGK